MGVQFECERDEGFCRLGEGSGQENQGIHQWVEQTQAPVLVDTNTRLAVGEGEAQPNFRNAILGLPPLPYWLEAFESFVYLTTRRRRLLSSEVKIGRAPHSQAGVRLDA